jgi:uncharacterized membrane protein
VLGNWLLLLTPPAWLGLAAALVLGIRERSRRIGPMGGIALLAIAWLVLVMVMTEAGYSGNSRYLLAPTALLYVVGGAGIARLAGTLTIEGPGRIAAAALAVLAVAGSVVWASQRMPFVLRDTRFQAHVAQNLDVAISRVGGREAILACGMPFTNKFLVQLVAWKLHVHGKQVLLDPAGGGAVMLRARHALGARAEPPLDSLVGRPTHRFGTRTALWRIETACGA